MQSATLASAECYIRWQSADSAHTDRQYFPKLDFWRDSFPADMGSWLQTSAPGAETAVDIEASEVLPVLKDGSQHTLSKRAVSEAFHTRHLSGPYKGRFYPRGLLAGISGIDGIFRQDQRPFRVSDITDERIHANLNHPLAGYSITVGGRVSEFLKSREERGGHCIDVIADIAGQGPGMQCRPESGAVSFIHDRAYRRADATDDAQFYSAPRMVQHIDSQARTFINQVYRRFITPGSRVLDLMSSWDSHLDGVPDTVVVHGLGMNAEELASNERLSGTVVQDLNRDTRLPYTDNNYDVVLCSASVEYLIRPVEVFTQVARLLKPGGYFVLSFSDRWFPPKVTQLWTELHPFERMGLVLEYFRQTGQFDKLATESFRGWPRPADDKYYRQRMESDPVFAVWGQRLEN